MIGHDNRGPTTTDDEYYSFGGSQQQLPKIVFGIDVKTLFFVYLDIHLGCKPFCLVKPYIFPQLSARYTHDIPRDCIDCIINLNFRSLKNGIW